MRYLELGGKRMGQVNDNIVSIRAWDFDPLDAKALWQAIIEALTERKKQQVVLHLPSISDGTQERIYTRLGNRQSRRRNRRGGRRLRRVGRHRRL